MRSVTSILPSLPSVMMAAFVAYLVKLRFPFLNDALHNLMAYRRYIAFVKNKLAQGGGSLSIGVFKLETVESVIICQVLAGSIGAGIALMLAEGGKIVVSAATFAICAWLPIMLLARASASRARRFASEIPGVMEVIALAISAGLEFETALNYIVDRSKGYIAGELRKAKAEIAAGANREDAYQQAAARGNRDMRLFISTMLQAEKQGKPVGDIVLNLATSIRNRQRLQLEAKANRLPTTMLMPIFVFIVPPILAVYLMPAIINLKYMSM
jgi:tight adherence protein C